MVKCGRCWRVCLAAPVPAGSDGACKLVIIMKVFTPWCELCFSYSLSFLSLWFSSSDCIHGPQRLKRQQEPRNRPKPGKGALELIPFWLILFCFTKSGRRDPTCPPSLKVSSSSFYPGNLCNFSFYVLNVQMPQSFLSPGTINLLGFFFFFWSDQRL